MITKEVIIEEIQGNTICLKDSNLKKYKQVGVIELTDEEMMRLLPKEKELIKIRIIIPTRVRGDRL